MWLLVWKTSSIQHSTGLNINERFFLGLFICDHEVLTYTLNRWACTCKNINKLTLEVCTYLFIKNVLPLISYFTVQKSLVLDMHMYLNAQLMNSYKLCNSWLWLIDSAHSDCFTVHGTCISNRHLTHYQVFIQMS